jgi:hypothetical protein
MANLDYRIEYVKFNNHDDGVFVHFRTDLPEYRSFVYRDDYFIGSDDVRTAFFNGIMNTPGVTACASQAFRLYLEKSPVFSWAEVLGPVMEWIRASVSATALNELFDSGNLVQPVDRRPVDYSLS